MKHETKLQIQAALAKRGWTHAAQVINEFVEALESTDEQKALRADAERSRAREAFLSPDRKEPLPAYGDRFPLSETLPGGDGDAYWATETHYYPRAPRDKRPEDATQIIYFSK